MSNVLFENVGRVGVLLDPRAHFPIIGKHVHQPTGVVDQLVVGRRIRDRLVQCGFHRDLAGDVAVEEFPVDGPSQQPRLRGRIVEPAQRLDHVDAAPSLDALGQPQQRRRAAVQPLQRPRDDGGNVFVEVEGDGRAVEGVQEIAGYSRRIREVVRENPCRGYADQAPVLGWPGAVSAAVERVVGVGLAVAGQR
ncbi:hypothetical protein AB0878_31140 [Amycolatopsis sp. NPDC047767]|uniref:hypothetical protein n=1 Tax=Amycolatopsis sp. NPDC047767 TaxID=3156765 RepID=UPI003453C059